jgi:hypothetical protein
MLQFHQKELKLTEATEAKLQANSPKIRRLHAYTTVDSKRVDTL